MSRKGGAHAYSRMGVESGVMAASPLQVIIMLYERSISLLRESKIHIEHGNMEGKGVALSKVIDIINNGLSLALDRSVNPEVADNLSSLYEYLVTSLILANRHNDVDKIDKAIEVLDELCSGWKAVQSSGG